MNIQPSQSPSNSQSRYLKKLDPTQKPQYQTLILPSSNIQAKQNVAARGHSKEDNISEILSHKVKAFKNQVPKAVKKVTKTGQKKKKQNQTLNNQALLNILESQIQRQQSDGHKEVEQIKDDRLLAASLNQ